LQQYIQTTDLHVIAFNPNEQTRKNHVNDEFILKCARCLM